ncbi:hypothetical protein ILUMI_15046, partial [Ignelater luminosus]
EFEEIITSIRNSTDEISNEIELQMSSTENQRRKNISENKNSIIAKEVCDTIIVQLKERLSYRGHLDAASLVNLDNFLRESVSEEGVKDTDKDEADDKADIQK